MQHGLLAQRVSAVRRGCCNASDASVPLRCGGKRVDSGRERGLLPVAAKHSVRRPLVHQPGQAYVP